MSKPRSTAEVVEALRRARQDGPSAPAGASLVAWWPSVRATRRNHNTIWAGLRRA